MQKRNQKLSDILAQGSGGGNGGGGGGGDWINGDWGDTPPAPEFGPVPSGTYEAHLVEKDVFTAGTGTLGVKLTFSILTEGPFQRRKLFYDIWLTAAAKPQALRDFAKLGIQDKAQIDLPLPTDKRIRCRIVVTIRKNKNDVLYNVVQRFEPLGVDPVEPDPFAPKDGGPTT